MVVEVLCCGDASVSGTGNLIKVEAKPQAVRSKTESLLWLPAQQQTDNNKVIIVLVKFLCEK